MTAVNVRLNIWVWGRGIGRRRILILVICRYLLQVTSISGDFARRSGQPAVPDTAAPRPRPCNPDAWGEPVTCAHYTLVVNALYRLSRSGDVNRTAE